MSATTFCCAHCANAHICLCAGRHLYALLTGFALIYYPFGNGCFHAFISSGATYLIMWRFRDHAATLAWLVDFMYLIGW